MRPPRFVTLLGAVLLAATLACVAPARAEKVAPVGSADPARIAGCLDDIYEPNDVCGSATPVGLGSYPGLQIISGNNDYYKISLQRNGTLTVTLSFTHANGDIDMELRDACPGGQVALSNGSTNTETIVYKNTGFTRNYYIRAYLFSGACNSYSMTIGITSGFDLIGNSAAPGWTAPIVTRNDGTASMPTATQSTSLTGNALLTWENFVSRDVSAEGGPEWKVSVYLDDSLDQANYTISENSALGYWYTINHGPTTIRGGRHTLEQIDDPDHLVVETNEANNDYSAQFVWSPLATSNGVPHVRYRPPDTGSGGIPNADGLTFTRAGGVAWVVSEAPFNGADDYDLLVYNNYLNSTSGFSTVIGSSNRGGNQTDFVVGHYNGTPTTVYPAVTRFSISGGGGDFSADQADASGRNGDLSSTSSISWKPITLPANRLTDVYEAFMFSGTTYYFSLRQLSGTGPIAFEIFPGSTGGVYGRSGGTSSAPTGTLQTLAYSASVTGWHPVVVYRANGANAATPLSYDFEWSTLNFVGVPEGGAKSLAFAGASPNPIRDLGRFAFTLPQAGRAQLAIFDVRGRLVRGLVDGNLGAGDHAAEWDARDAGGAQVGAGIYWARLRVGDRTLSRRVAVVP
jgi:hypothetical protein